MTYEQETIFVLTCNARRRRGEIFELHHGELGKTVSMAGSLRTRGRGWRHKQTMLINEESSTR